MRFYEAIEVVSPKDFIHIIEVIDNGEEDSYALAIIDWEGEKQLAIRWNVARREWDDPEKINERKTCVGMPSSHGYPVWFVLPNEFLSEIMDKNSTLFKQIKSSI